MSLRNLEADPMNPEQELIVGLGPSSGNFLDDYLSLKSKDYVAASGPQLGKIDTDNLRNDIQRVIGRTTQFLTDPGIRQDSQLVLGHIQSGKTAHLLGVIAALVESRTCLCVLLSGVTGALNRQTQLRLQDDLESLPGHAVKAFPVPTEARLDQSDVFSELHDLVARRVDVSRGATYRVMPPLPVLAVLESKARVASVSVIVDRFREEFGPDFTVVLIDDEADQASQNAKAKKSEESEIYRILKEIRAKDVRNCLLSYTATPQAVLLTSLDGSLRPRLCALTKTGIQYFGLNDLLSDELAKNRIPISDLPQSLPSPPPASLRRALIEFFLVGMIRRMKPSVFYSCDRRLRDYAVPSLKSVQFLIHPSGRQVDHSIFYQWVKEINKDVVEKLGHGYAEPDVEFVNGELSGCYRELVSGLAGLESDLPLEIPDDWRNDLCASVSNSTRVLMVNSDKRSPTADEDMPSRAKDWEKSDQWILIGGDILGRGVTIPQLISTYFLRNPKSPQFDTLSQQMRFCGYRSRYSRFVKVWAPSDIFDLFKEMQQADSVLYRFARHWDETERDLKKYGGEIVFVQPGKKSINPTRPGVLDPSVKRTELREIVFQTKNYAVPDVCRSNSRVFLQEVLNVGVVDEESDDWQIIEDVPREWFLEMFRRFEFSGSDSQRQSAVEVVLDPSLGELGLSALPIAVAFRSVREMTRISHGMMPETRVGAERGCRNLVTRALSGELMTIWEDHLRQSNSFRQAQWFDHVELVPVVGGTQRGVRDRLNVSSCLFSIELFDLMNSEVSQTKSSGNHIGYGLGLSFLAPKNFKVDSWGFN